MRYSFERLYWRCVGMDNKIIVIADDSPLNREMIKIIFEEQYEIAEVADGEEVITYIEKNSDQIGMVFLDLLMPKKTGLEVLSYMSQNQMIRYIPVIMIIEQSSAEEDELAYEYGASDIIYKPFAPNVVMRRAKNIMELYSNRIELEKRLTEQTWELMTSREKLEKSNEFLINALCSVVELRSSESGEHIKRVKLLTGIMLKYITHCYPKYGINAIQEQLIVNASALHDLGKIAIPDNILTKPGKLTDEEFEIMKKHTVYGCELLEKFKQGEDEFYKYCYDICLYHHERVDGKGYPYGLVGDEIPIWAQIVSVVDVYDALVNTRVYKNALPVRAAEQMIKSGECGAFSQEILSCFDLAKSEFAKVIKENMPIY